VYVHTGLVRALTAKLTFQPAVSSHIVAAAVLHVHVVCVHRHGYSRGSSASERLSHPAMVDMAPLHIRIHLRVVHYDACGLSGGSAVCGGLAPLDCVSSRAHAGSEPVRILLSRPHRSLECKQPIVLAESICMTT
jgi:hypothetical protein